MALTFSLREKAGMNAEGVGVVIKVSNGTDFNTNAKPIINPIIKSTPNPCCT